MPPLRSWPLAVAALGVSLMLGVTPFTCERLPPPPPTPAVAACRRLLIVLLRPQLLPDSRGVARLLMYTHPPSLQ